jgi:hypothetical protein
MLFTAVSSTLQAFASDPQWRLEGQLGFLSILHTWNQKLLDHFHLHCVVPAGVLQQDKTWKSAANTNFLFKICSLSKAFRRCYLNLLQQAYLNGKLIFPGKTSSLAQTENFTHLIDQLSATKWILYAKCPFAGPQQVLEYLGRYTHRVAISNHRITSLQKHTVTFSYKDRNDHDQVKLLSLDAHEFIRRFLLHILPSGFMKIRHFGFLANTCKQENLKCIHEQLGVPHQDSLPVQETVAETMLRLTGLDITLCPQCNKGHMIRISSFPPVHDSHRRGRESFDSS